MPKYLIAFTDPKIKPFNGSFHKCVDYGFHESNLKMKEVSLTPSSVFRISYNLKDEEGKIFASIVPNTNS